MTAHSRINLRPAINILLSIATGLAAAAVVIRSQRDRAWQIAFEALRCAAGVDDAVPADPDRCVLGHFQGSGGGRSSVALVIGASGAEHV
jgi:hypothetical protein